MPSPDEYLLNEIKELLALATPEAWRQTIESLYFNYVIECGYPSLPDPKNTTARIYALIEFFEEISQSKDQIGPAKKSDFN